MQELKEWSSKKQQGMREACVGLAFEMMSRFPRFPLPRINGRIFGFLPSTDEGLTRLICTRNPEPDQRLIKRREIRHGDIDFRPALYKQELELDPPASYHQYVYISWTFQEHGPR